MPFARFFIAVLFLYGIFATNEDGFATNLKKELGELSPGKMNIFRFIPLNVLAFALKIIFNSRFGDKFMYRHAMKAQDEMKQLHKQFYTYLRRRKNGII